MKLGCCVNMFSDENDPIGAAYIPGVKNAGFDYVELPLAQVMELPETAFENLLEKLREVHLPCEACNNFFPATLRLTGNETNPEAIERYISQGLARAGRLGAKVVVFGSSGAKNVPPGFSRAAAWEQIVDVLRMAQPYVKRENLDIVIEPLSTRESNIINTVEEGYELMKAAACPNVRLLVDYYHFAAENHPVESLRPYVPAIRHIHFAEPQGRTIPQEDKRDYRAFFDTVKAGGYCHRVSVEAYGEKPEKALKKASFLRNYF